jgi:CRP-like cAMP-binding protein
VVAGSTGEAPGVGALYLSDGTDGLNEGAGFLHRLSAHESAAILAAGRPIAVRDGDAVFRQGDPHLGIFLIREGRVRVYHTGPSGREITLAYWTPGHFIGGPEIYGGGQHVWSGEAVEDGKVLLFPSAVIRGLIAKYPMFAVCLIDGLVAKGRCYSALLQMLGTRSAVERLAQFLLNVAEIHGETEGSRIVVTRAVTHDQIGSMVGTTRQWVTMTLRRFEQRGIIRVTRQAIVIEKAGMLHAIISGDEEAFA